MVTGVLAFTLIIGYVGIDKYLAAIGASNGFVDVIYVDVQLFALQIPGAVAQPGYPWQMDVARVLAPIVTSYTAIRAVMIVFSDRIDTIAARFSRQHVIVAGLSDMGVTIAIKLRAAGFSVVAVDPDPDPELRARVRDERIKLIDGDARQPAVLRRARAARARTVVACADDDGVNAAIAVVARSFAEERQQPLTCLAHVTSPELCNLLRAREMSIGREHLFYRLDFFNTDETAARVMLLEHLPSVAAGAEDMVVVGASGAAEHVIIAAARQRSREVAPLEVRWVAPGACELVLSLQARHPVVAGSTELTPIELDIDAAEFAEAEFVMSHSGPVDAVFICVDDDGHALSAALTLHRRLADAPTPVVVQTTNESGLASLLRADRAGFETVHAFATYDRTCDPEVLLAGTLETMARAMHEAYAAKEAALGRTTSDNPSMARWDELPEAMRESNRDQAAHVGVKLEAAGCTLERLVPGGEMFQFDGEEFERLAELEHERWVRDHERNGWTLGPAKDPNGKVTPYLVPYDELSEEIKDYDRDTIERLPAFLASLGYQIKRVAPSPIAR